MFNEKKSVYQFIADYGEIRKNGVYLETGFKTFCKIHKLHTEQKLQSEWISILDHYIQNPPGTVIVGGSTTGRLEEPKPENTDETRDVKEESKKKNKFSGSN